MATHHLPATSATVHFGTFDACIPPVLTVASGDTVIIETVSGGPEVMPPSGSPFVIPPALALIHAAKLERLGPHILTGPVAVRGAEPGDILEIGIDDVELAADWGYTLTRPLVGTLPDDFPDPTISFIPIDRAARTCKPDWGPSLPLRPFFGTLGVAPRPEYGRLSSREPREHGGNLDNRELIAGTSLFLPVWTPGANVSIGDGHGLQGDGEVCVTALETSLVGTFSFRLHKAAETALPSLYPWAETPTHYITMGLHADLDRAVERAVREMIALIVARTPMERQQAYQLCSLAVDLRVTQVVNGEKGAHAMILKSLLQPGSLRTETAAS